MTRVGSNSDGNSQAGTFRQLLDTIVPKDHFVRIWRVHDVEMIHFLLYNQFCIGGKQKAEKIIEFGSLHQIAVLPYTDDGDKHGSGFFLDGHLAD